MGGLNRRPERSAQSGSASGCCQPSIPVENGYRLRIHWTIKAVGIKLVNNATMVGVMPCVDRLLLLQPSTRLDQVQSRCPAGSNQSRWSSDGLLPCARVRQNHGRNLHLSTQRLGGMPEPSNTAAYSDVAHALERIGDQGRRHPGTAPAK